MSEWQLIESALKRAALRRRLHRVWRFFWLGLLVGAAVWVLPTIIYKLFPAPAWIIRTGAIAGGCVLAASLVVGLWHKSSLLATARWVDEKKHLQERLSTALELSGQEGSSEWKRLVMSDASEHARKLNPQHLVAFGWPVAGRWAVVILVLGSALGFIPEYRSQATIQKEQIAANIKETGKQLAGFTRQNLQHRPPALEPTQKALEKVAEAGDKLAKANLTRSEALRDLANVAEKLSQQAKELGKNPALKPLERAARENDSGSSAAASPEALRKQAEALQEKLGKTAEQPNALDKAKTNLEKAQQDLAKSGSNSPADKAARDAIAQSLADLASQMKDMGVSLPNLEAALKALENNQTDLVMKKLQNALNDIDKLKEMAKALQQMQQQSAKIGKDLAEQLEKGQAQAAQQTLQKMIDQLKSGKCSQEQLQKMQDEISKAIQPGSKYGKVGEHLSKAAQQCQGGQKGEAAQSLAEAAKELEKLQQQLADLNSMLDGLDALDRAQMAICQGKGWKECEGTCPGCNGKGCGRCRGKGWSHGGGASAGVGTWADETGWTKAPDEQIPVDNSGIVRPDMDARGHTERDALLNPNLAPTKVPGQISKGGPLPSITLKGVSIKGKSTVEYEAAATAAQSDAQSALNQDKVPRAYQDAVRDYFDDLKK